MLLSIFSRILIPSFWFETYRFIMQVLMNLFFKVVESMSLAITDLMEAEFTDLRNDNGESLLKPDIQFSDWIKQTYLSSGSLLARSCRSAVELADHREDQREAAASFGENMAYLQQVRNKNKNNARVWNPVSQMLIVYLDFKDNHYRYRRFLVKRKELISM